MKRDDASFVHELRERSVQRTEIHPYDFFEIDQTFDHHWGRTISAAENALFATITLNFNPLYFNEEYARNEGHPTTVVCPMLAFNTIFGLSVQDNSEAGGFFLGIEDLIYHQPIHSGDTLTARSTVKSKRESSSDTEHGIVTWDTVGHNQHGELVISFTRTNLVKKKAQ